MAPTAVRQGKLERNPRACATTARQGYGGAAGAPAPAVVTATIVEFHAGAQIFPHNAWRDCAAASGWGRPD